MKYANGGILPRGTTTVVNDTGHPIHMKPAPWAHRDRLALVNFGGYAVMERPDLLRYDEVVADRVARVLIVGERKHLAWRLDMEALKDQMRADLRYRIETWESSLGLA